MNPISSEHTGREAEIQARLAAATETDGRSIGAIQNGKKELRRSAPADLRYLLERNALLEGQLAKAEEELNEQRWYGEQLQTALDSCSGNHLKIEEYPGGPSNGS